MYQILQETGLSDKRASEAVTVMKELQHQSLDHLATKADLELLSAKVNEKFGELQRNLAESMSNLQVDLKDQLSAHQRDMTEKLSLYQRDMTERLSSHQSDMTEKLSLYQRDMTEKLSLHQTNVAEKMSRYHRNTIVWVVSTVATGVTLAVALFGLAIRYLP